MAGAAAFGGMIGSVLAPLIVRSNPANIPVLNTVLPSLALAGFLLTWLSVTSSLPPSPPSPSAETSWHREAETLGNLHRQPGPPPHLSLYLSLFSHSVNLYHHQFLEGLTFR